ncbi:MAG: hypothetical protein CL681_24795 [Blastopirellula sp.]|nr:hypothetical protein [Blastopirellula sp.]
MQNKDHRRSLTAALGSLGWPLVVGLGACGAFYALLLNGPLANPTLQRYFASHPVSYTATAMFFVGLTAMGMKLLNVMGQSAVMSRIGFGDRSQAEPAAGAEHLLQQLDELTSFEQATYLGTRLRDALNFVHRTKDATGIEDELKHLADLDVGRQQDSYALPRIIIWATPMLGFLGTVIGITQALGDLDPAEMASSIETATDKLLSGLYVAFDTTALALSLSIILMFVQFLIDRFETHLLAIVDARANEELVGRFEQVGTGSDPHIASVQRMCEAVMGTTEKLVHQQSAIWQETIEAAHQHWSQIVGSSTSQLQTALGNALDGSLEKHAETVAATQQLAINESATLRREWHEELTASHQLMRDQYQKMAEHGELMQQVMQATGEVIQLEAALNQNLHSLSGAKNFEDTVMSLSAAIHLLNARLGSAPTDGKQVELQRKSHQEQAA